MGVGGFQLSPEPPLDLPLCIWVGNGTLLLFCYLFLEMILYYTEEFHLSRDMWFPTMWHFDMCSLRRACAVSC